MSMETLNILNGISHVLGNFKHDGAVDSEGEPIKIGLKREKGHPIKDSRVMDGFSVKMHGDKLWICYHVEVKIKDVHNKKFEAGIEQSIADVESFLKREYRKHVGKALSLSPDAKPQIDVEYISRVRTAVYAARCFTVGGMDSESPKEKSKEKLDKSIKDFLGLGGTEKNPKNKKSKEKDSYEPFHASKMKTGIRK